MCREVFEIQIKFTFHCEKERVFIKKRTLVISDIHDSYDEFIFKEDTSNNRFKKIKYIINEEDCWICTSHYKDKDGYFNIKRYTNNKVFRKLHRYIYELHNGNLNDELVLHECNNPSCINPNHLRKGTHLENMKDRLESGHYYNEYSSFAKITEDQARKIKILLSEGVTHQKISNQMNVSIHIVADISRGRTWNRVKI